ncbi:DUF4172 domain-containing protein [Agrobacterium tumefaciens]|jgi:hypothetical protein|uniref:DUF4172 domain-containing protein n=2 Tax=Rhizobium/Agrobacterium group TaxID=227290 RepID=UPI00396A106E
MAGQGFKTNLRPNFTASAMWNDRMGQAPVLRDGEVIGAVRHFNEDNSKQRCIELLGDEAVKTSEVEGGIYGPRECPVIIAPEFRSVTVISLLTYR